MNQTQRDAIAAAEKALAAAKTSGDQNAINTAQANLDRLNAEAKNS